MVTHRKELRETLGQLIGLLCDEEGGVSGIPSPLRGERVGAEGMAALRPSSRPLLPGPAPGKRRGGVDAPTTPSPPIPPSSASSTG